MTQPVAQTRHAVARSGFANPLTLGIKVTTASFVEVYADDMLLQLGFDYTIDGLGDPAGIEITILDGEDVGSYVDVETFAAVFNPLYEQGADLSAGGNFGLAFEAAIDALNRQNQALDDRLRRSLTLPPTYSSEEQLAFPLPMSGRVLVGNATNTGFENGATLPEIETIVGLTDEIVILSGIAPQIVEVAAVDSQIVTLAAVSASIAALGPIAADITTLAPQAANIATLAPQAANIGIVGSNIASVVTVAGSIANVNVVATNITSVSTAAANMAAIIAAPGAATAAANSATAANNSAIAAAASAASVDAANFQWLSKAIGELFAVDTSKTGVATPPTNHAGFRFIDLTAGLTGAGQYNNGVLTGETVTGTAPLVVATATISLAGSPMNGQVISLINTERRFLRAGSPGTLENDAMQGHYHNAAVDGRTLRPFSTNAGSSGGAAGSLDGAYQSSTTGVPVTDTANGTPRTANETRSKNIGLRYFMRIK